MIVLLDLTQKKVETALAIRDKYSLLMAAVATPYSSEERETWHIQVKEADAYLAEPTTLTPMLSAMATSRGISLSEMVAKVKENDTLFCVVIGDLLGSQQKELDNLNV